MSKNAEMLIRELVREIAIAGEVDVKDLYADYRPADAKEYIGMVPDAPSNGASSSSNADDGGEEAPSNDDDVATEQKRAQGRRV